MFKVDFNQKKFLCQTSFTYLDWKIAETIIKENDFNFGDVY